MARVTLDQKRLEALRRQLYGKVDSEPPAYNFQQYNKEESSKNTQESKLEPEIKSEVAYLRKDLLKILSLSSLAMSVQLLLYLATRNNLVNLTF